MGLSLTAPAAHATIQNLKSFKEAYPERDAKTVSCKVCHEHPIGRKGDLDAYGLALQALKGEGGAKALTEEDYRAIEDGDADGDGATNLEELMAGTNPADAASVPASAVEDHDEGAVEEEPVEHEHPDDHSALPVRHRGNVVEGYLEAVAGSQAWAAEGGEGRTEQEAGEATEPAQAEYVGTETCAACHAKQFQEFKQSTHARIAIPGDVGFAQGCETCHGPGSLHVAAGGGRGVGGIINPSKDPSSCFECHLDKKAEFRLPYHHPVMEGKMSCADCHNAHAPEVRPWSATSLWDVNEACFQCHKDKRGPFVFEHEALREGCTTCHKVHGSIHQAMLRARDSNLCLRCHSQMNFPRIGDSNHSSRLREGSCFSAGCHSAVHGSNFDDHLRY